MEDVSNIPQRASVDSADTLPSTQDSTEFSDGIRQPLSPHARREAYLKRLEARPHLGLRAHHLRFVADTVAKELGERPPHPWTIARWWRAAKGLDRRPVAKLDRLRRLLRINSVEDRSAPLHPAYKGKVERMFHRRHTSWDLMFRPVRRQSGLPECILEIIEQPSGRGLAAFDERQMRRHDLGVLLSDVSRVHGIPSTINLDRRQELPDRALIKWAQERHVDFRISDVLGFRRADHREPRPLSLNEPKNSVASAVRSDNRSRLCSVPESIAPDFHDISPKLDVASIGASGGEIRIEFLIDPLSLVVTRWRCRRLDQDGATVVDSDSGSRRDEVRPRATARRKRVATRDRISVHVRDRR